MQSAASWRELNASPYGTKPLQSGVIWVRERHGKRRVPLSSVEQIVAEREYARLFTDDRTHLIRRSLSSLAEELSPQGFCRVHRSAIVNLGAVSGVVQRRGGGLAVQLASGAAAAIGPAFLPDFRRRL
ncbi:MAG TPA: LytTR family DNA-binding domain-containing protein [Microvirga sp.]|nr:LytTR family DNA-binding domain-containing protein [Microvirga sp.]